MNGNLFSYPSEPTDNKPREAPAAPAEDKLAQMNDSLERMQSDLRRNRLQIERQTTDHDTHVRRTKVLWAVAIVLLICLAGIAWFGYPYAKESNLFAQVPALQSVVQGLGDKMASIEKKQVAGAAEQTTLTNRFSGLEQSVNSNLRDIRNHTQSVATQMGTRIRNEMSHSLTAIQNRLSGVESNQRESSEHVAKLESELATLRQEMRNAQQQSARQLEQAQQQLNQAQQVTISELSDVKQHVNSSNNRIDAVVDRINTERTDFVVPRNKTAQVAPGIYLTIKDTDVAQ